MDVLIFTALMMTMTRNGNYDDPDDDCEKYYFCVSGIAYPAV